MTSKKLQAKRLIKAKRARYRAVWEKYKQSHKDGALNRKRKKRSKKDLKPVASPDEVKWIINRMKVPKSFISSSPKPEDADQ